MVMDNINRLKRKEETTIRPTDLWTQEDEVFLKYCPNKRMKCYHTVSKDTSCIPHEIVKLLVLWSLSEVKIAAYEKCFNV